MENYNQPFLRQCPIGTSAYTIMAGDTFFALSQRYGMTSQDIIAANPGVNPNNLQIGQTICLPSIASPMCPEGTVPYTIKAGDSFYNLAQRYGMATQSIIDANPSVNPNNLQIGQIICLPAQSKTLDFKKNLGQPSETTKKQSNPVKRTQQEEIQKIAPLPPIARKQEYLQDIKEDYESKNIKIDYEYDIEKEYEYPNIKEKYESPNVFFYTPKQNICNGCSLPYILVLIAILILFTDSPKHNEHDNSKKGSMFRF